MATKDLSRKRRKMFFSGTSSRWQSWPTVGPKQDFNPTEIFNPWIVIEFDLFLSTFLEITLLLIPHIDVRFNRSHLWRTNMYRWNLLVSSHIWWLGDNNQRQWRACKSPAKTQLGNTTDGQNPGSLQMDEFRKTEQATSQLLQDFVALEIWILASTRASCRRPFPLWSHTVCEICVCPCGPLPPGSAIYSGFSAYQRVAEGSKLARNIGLLPPEII